MRIQNSLKNMAYGVFGQLISAVLGFVVRTAFIYTLGIEYVGVEGLFSSILIMLSLANLGFDTAMIYSLYKPLADNDVKKIQALMNLFQKAYRIIGLVVLIIGLSLIPFLPFLINGETTIKHINWIYLLFLVNSVSSYYFIYKQTIVIADQRNHILSKIHSVFTIISNTLQIVVLVSLSNYMIVLASQIAFRIIENVYVSLKTNKLYPYLKETNSEKLSLEERKAFFGNLYALMLYKLSGIVIHGKDNILIAKFVGVVAVGVYSNYLLIISTLNTFLSYLFYSITASVGNLHVKESAEKKYFVFRILNFSNFWVYGFCSVCLWCLINPLISFWIGDRYVLDKLILLAILANFYTAGMQNASTTFRDTTGLFKKGKYRPVIAAFINIAVSIALAPSLGIAGVLMGTVLSRLCTYFWYDPHVIFKFVFEKPVKTYFLKYFLFLLLVTAAAGVTEILGNLLNLQGISDLFVRLGICLIVPNVLFFAIFRKTEEYTYLWGIVSSFINKARTKIPVRQQV
jgi:O-antigen/teichoic acid export membrane protein